LAAREFESVVSFARAGYFQVLWSDVPMFSNGGLVSESMPGLFALDVLSLVDVAWWRRTRCLPAQQVKDILTFTIMQVYGGLYADLKVHALPGRTLPTPRAGVSAFVATEPAKNYGHRTTRAEYYDHFGATTALGQPWLGVAWSMPAAPFVSRVLPEMVAFWDAVAETCAEDTTINWSNDPRWMTNATILHRHASRAHDVEILPPRIFCSLPGWAKQDCLGTATRNFGYYVPLLAQLFATEEIQAVTAWSAARGHWTEEFEQHVIGEIAAFHDREWEVGPPRLLCAREMSCKLQSFQINHIELLRIRVPGAHEPYDVMATCGRVIDALYAEPSLIEAWVGELADVGGDVTYLALVEGLYELVREWHVPLHGPGFAARVVAPIAVRELVPREHARAAKCALAAALARYREGRPVA